MAKEILDVSELDMLCSVVKDIKSFVSPLAWQGFVDYLCSDFADLPCR